MRMLVETVGVMRMQGTDGAEAPPPARPPAASSRRRESAANTHPPPPPPLPIHSPATRAALSPELIGGAEVALACPALPSATPPLPRPGPEPDPPRLFSNYRGPACVDFYALPLGPLGPLSAPATPPRDPRWGLHRPPGARAKARRLGRLAASGRPRLHSLASLGAPGHPAAQEADGPALALPRSYSCCGEGRRSGSLRLAKRAPRGTSVEDRKKRRNSVPSASRLPQCLLPAKGRSSLRHPRLGRKLTLLSRTGVGPGARPGSRCVCRCIPWLVSCLRGGGLSSRIKRQRRKIKKNPIVF
ncbi:uncharacterized protein LOC141550533 [Sminthopsis crassicaudata]|uniref:uncharacterized protein LOC141550533 n=1 Tax=Sminthopsis crassicaudata TaxID=9301 RepID=UPI003D68D992